MADALSDDPNVRRRRLGIELRRLREAAGLGQREVARAQEWSLSKVVRVETGASSISINDLKSLLSAYGVTDAEQVATLTQAARAGRGKPWWHQYQDIVPEAFARFLGYEDMASQIWQTHPLLVPSLLHTEDYAAELYAGFAESGVVFAESSNARRLVELRMRRQQRLFAQRDTAFTFMIGQAALYPEIGGPQVMREQLEHLLTVGQQDNVDVRIVPFSAPSHPGLAGPFNMLRDRVTGDETVFIESAAGSRLVQNDPEEIARYRMCIETMSELSKDAERTEALLREQIDRLRDAEQAAPGANQ